MPVEGVEVGQLAAFNWWKAWLGHRPAVRIRLLVGAAVRGRALQSMLRC